MLFIHLTPYNDSLTPWLIDYSIVDTSFNITNRGRIVIKPALGIIPSPKYAVNFEEDFTIILKDAINYEEAGNILSRIIQTEDQIAFSNIRSYSMFLNLLNILLLPNILSNKIIVSCKSILNATNFFKELYPKELKTNIKQIASALNISTSFADTIPNEDIFKNTAVTNQSSIENNSLNNITNTTTANEIASQIANVTNSTATNPNSKSSIHKLKDDRLIDKIVAIFQYINTKEQRLINYFINRKYQITSDLITTKPNIIAITEQNVYLVVPLVITSDYMIAYDLSSTSLTNPKYLKFALNGETIFSIETAISKSPKNSYYLEQLGLSLTLVTSKKHDFISIINNNDQLLQQTKLANDASIKNPIDIYTYAYLEKYQTISKNSNYLQICTSKQNPDLLSKSALDISDIFIRNLVLDYLYAQYKAILPETIISTYNIIVTHRIEQNRTKIENEFTEVSGRITGNHIAIEKLENLYNMLAS